MLRSLFSGISGLRTHQQMMDVTGNNIANVNTTGYKTAHSLFQDTLSQLLKAAGAPQAGNGGSNPAQIGLGVRLAGVSTSFEQGAAQTTGRSTDLMINGDGFFVIRNGREMLYTRAGSFSMDADGRLCDPQGAVVQGWLGVNGTISTNGTATDVRLPIGTLLRPQATTGAVVSGNLPGDSTDTAPIVKSITAYDQQGNAKLLSATFTRVSATSWQTTVSDGVATTGPQLITFGADGSTPSATSMTVNGITVDLSGITSYAGASTVAAQSQNGSTMGALQAFTLSPDGTVMGVFTNGLKQPLAQIAMASFNNPAGLEKAGNSLFRVTPNSGTALLGTAGAGGRGDLRSGALEMSNVDLAQEFSDLVIAQRGFQANSKVISTSDELLQELVNLKR